MALMAEIALEVHDLLGEGGAQMTGVKCGLLAGIGVERLVPRD